MVDKNIYLNCGIYKDGKQKFLFIAVPGFYASTAWCVSDEIYNSVFNSVLSGKFVGITSDDNESYILNREYIYRITEHDDVDDILKRSNSDFVKYFKETFYYENLEA